jgi:hypothetical protein
MENHKHVWQKKILHSTVLTTLLHSSYTRCSFLWCTAHTFPSSVTYKCEMINRRRHNHQNRRHNHHNHSPYNRHHNHNRHNHRRHSHHNHNHHQPFTSNASFTPHAERSRPELISFGKQTNITKRRHSHCTPRRNEPSGVDPNRP